MTGSVNKLYDKGTLERIFGETIARDQNQKAYLYFSFKCGMNFKRYGNQVIYYIIGQKY